MPQVEVGGGGGGGGGDGGGAGFTVNAAATLLFVVRVTLQIPVPEQDPDQPLKVEPEAADAVSEIVVPEFALSEQVEPHEIVPPVTVPDPVPDFVTESV